MNQTTDEGQKRKSLFQKWRSKDFSEIVGQPHVTRTIKNALQTDRIASAYLFCGPRGTGKTSSARILAKAINCPNTKDGHPCNKCHVCRGINNGSFLDVIEMDAASHTQVDKIREFIVEKVNFRPVEAKKKVYIIDEVHKLSSYSFDALLKTIEEPPPFVIFILATTEPEKLPPTILSRCQRFDFKRIPINLIVDRLHEISQAEDFDIEEGALNMIAQASDGALRDALVILEQAVSFSGDRIHTGDVVSLLGMTGPEALFKFAEMILEKDTAKALEYIDEMYRDGRDLNRLAIDMTEHFRRLLIIRMVRGAETILEITDDMYSRLDEQASRFKSSHLLHIISLLIELRKNLKDMGMERVQWEIAAVKLTKWEISPSIDNLNKKISALEKAIAGGGSIPQKPAQPGPAAANPQAYKPPPACAPPVNKPAPQAPPAQYKAPPPPQPARPEQSPRAAEKPAPAQKPLAQNTVSYNDAGLWHKLLREIKKERFDLLPILQDVGAGVLKNSDYIFNIGEKNLFNRNILEANRKYIQDMLSAITGTRIRMVLNEAGGKTLLPQDQKPHREFVDEVRDIFNATEVDKPAD